MCTYNNDWQCGKGVSKGFRTKSDLVCSILSVWKQRLRSSSSWPGGSGLLSVLLRAASDRGDWQGPDRFQTETGIINKVTQSHWHCMGCMTRCWLLLHANMGYMAQLQVWVVSVQRPCWHSRTPSQSKKMEVWAAKRGGVESKPLHVTIRNLFSWALSLACWLTDSTSLRGHNHWTSWWCLHIGGWHSTSMWPWWFQRWRTSTTLWVLGTSAWSTIPIGFGRRVASGRWGSELLELELGELVMSVIIDNVMCAPILSFQFFEMLQYVMRWPRSVGLKINCHCALMSQKHSCWTNYTIVTLWTFWLLS